MDGTDIFLVFLTVQYVVPGPAYCPELLISSSSLLQLSSKIYIHDKQRCNIFFKNHRKVKQTEVKKKKTEKNSDVGI